MDSDTDLERAFELFDDDETGSISLRNLRRVARQLGEDVGEEELQAMLEAADRRGTGEVSLEDFKRVMRKANLAKWDCVVERMFMADMNKGEKTTGFNLLHPILNSSTQLIIYPKWYSFHAKGASDVHSFLKIAQF